MKGIMLVILYSIIFSCANHKENSNCNITTPPLDSGVNGIHGIYVFIYPKKIPDNYNGCQTIWDEDGQKWLTIIFKNSAPVRLDAEPAKLSKDKFTCRYRNKAGLADNTKSCFKYDEIKNGFPSVDKLKIKIPKNRDPRA